MDGKSTWFTFRSFEYFNQSLFPIVNLKRSRSKREEGTIVRKTWFSFSGIFDSPRVKLFSRRISIEFPLGSLYISVSRAGLLRRVNKQARKTVSQTSKHVSPVARFSQNFSPCVTSGTKTGGTNGRVAIDLLPRPLRFRLVPSFEFHHTGTTNILNSGYKRVRDSFSSSNATSAGYNFATCAAFIMIRMWFFERVEKSISHLVGKIIGTNINFY